MNFISTNPYTGEVLGSYAALSESSFAGNIAKARLAQKQWQADKNIDFLFKLAESLRNNKEGHARLITLETGKKITEARQEVEKCALCCEYYGKFSAQWLEDEPLAYQGAYLRREPLGVILGIMPWNFPFWQVIRFAVPAIAAGNAVLVKHAPNTMGCALALEELFASNRLDGLYQNFPVRVEDVEKIMPSVQAVSLTGSSRAGSSVAQLAGKYLKKSVLELGGSDAFVVLADADLEMAAQTAFQSRLINAGQSCIAAKRFIILESVFDEFCQKLIEKIETLVAGNPLDEKTTLAPLARKDLKENLELQLSAALSKSAKLLFRSQQQAGVCGFAPAIVLDTDADPEEFFGPVFYLIKAKDENHAIQLANQSRYGLGGSIWTTDQTKGKQLAQELDAGCVFVNSLVFSDPRLPFGGIKESGFGRELSHLGLYEFCNSKTIVIN